MATTLLGETTVHTVGDLPDVGSQAPDFTLTGSDFADVTKTPGKRTILDIFPSIGTGVCQSGIRFSHRPRNDCSVVLRSSNGSSSTLPNSQL